jgi:fluoride ion exporter CrcB/FEX
VEDGKAGYAALYVTSSVALGLAAVFTGAWLARSL